MFIFLLNAMFFTLPIIIGYVLKKTLKRRSGLFILNCIILLYFIEYHLIQHILSVMYDRNIITIKIAQARSIIGINFFWLILIFIPIWIYSIINLEKVIHNPQNTKDNFLLKDVLDSEMTKKE